MNGSDRRSRILKRLQESRTPVSGSALAKEFKVSRQVIVQDIALLRANDNNIFSTNRGYVMEGHRVRRVFKVKHEDSETEEELLMIIHLGGQVEDVFINHRVYGVMRGRLDLRSDYDVKSYMKSIATGRSSLLMNITSGYHYHTVSADSEEVLDRIQKALQERGFLAPLQDYEPVRFGGREDETQQHTEKQDS